jgi:hypothetical protein
MPQTYIVAEISKTYCGWWEPGINRAGLKPSDCLGGLFEQVIRENLGRGYELHDWKLATTAAMVPEEGGVHPQFNETIIAVFRLIKPQPRRR